MLMIYDSIANISRTDREHVRCRDGENAKIGELFDAMFVRFCKY